MLPRRLTLPPRPPAKLNPSLSHSCKLFCAPQKVNSRQINNFRSLLAKHTGWGGYIRIHPIPLLPPSQAPPSASIPSALNQLRILPVATGGTQHSFSPCSSDPTVQAQVSSLQSLAASSASTCALFQPPVLYFQQLAASFSKTPGVGSVRLPISSARSLRPLHLCVILWTFSDLPRHCAALFRLSTGDCRLPRHNAKIHSTPL